MPALGSVGGEQDRGMPVAHLGKDSTSPAGPVGTMEDQAEALVPIAWSDSITVTSRAWLLLVELRSIYQSYIVFTIACHHPSKGIFGGLPLLSTQLT